MFPSVALDQAFSRGVDVIFSLNGKAGSIQSEGAASSDDTESTNYDENAIDTSGARLPAAGDYVDSREVEAEQNRKTDAPAVVAEPDLTGLESVFQAEKEEASEDISEVGQKIGELVNEILELSPEINESIPTEEGNAVGEEDSSDAGISEADNSNVDTVDEEIVEDRPVFIADSQDDSEEDNTRPEIGQGVQEIARVLPVDEEKVELDSTLFRKGDSMGQGVKAKKRPSSAAFSSTFLSLIFTVVFYVHDCDDKNLWLGILLIIAELCSIKYTMLPV
ncbi:hypothetical protein COOONC_05475 [Cooperia oncophora]